MDATPHVLAERVRARRVAVDNDLELLRVRLQKADPRRIGRADAQAWAARAVPAIAGMAAVWLWTRRRRRVNSLERLLAHGLSDLYHSERQLVGALGRMADKASNPELRSAFEAHRIETEGHVERLERVFRSIGARPGRCRTTAGVSGLIAEGERLLGRRATRQVRDAWLIATAQRIEHVEIASYGSLRTFAGTLGFTHAAQLLQQSLDEERAADVKLTALAERFVNPRAPHAGRH